TRRSSDLHEYRADGRCRNEEIGFHPEAISNAEFTIGRASPCTRRDELHIAPILAADFVQRAGYPAERTGLDGVHQFRKHVASRSGDFLQARDRVGTFLGVLGIESCHIFYLGILFGNRRPDEFLMLYLVFLSLARQEGVHTDDRIGTVVFPALVVQAFFLDLAALVHRVHGSQDAAAFRYPVELLVYRFLDEIGQLIDDKGALPRILAVIQAQLLRNDELYGNRAPYGLLRGSCDRLVERVRMQAVAVVEHRIQRLQRGANVVEADFLGVQAAPGRLDVVFEHLAAGARTVAFPHGA